MKTSSSILLLTVTLATSPAYGVLGDDYPSDENGCFRWEISEIFAPGDCGFGNWIVGPKAINDNGDIAYEASCGFGSPRSFVRYGEDEPIMIPPFGVTWSTPEDINDAGVVVGWKEAPGPNPAYVYDGTTTTLIWPPDDANIRAHAVNNRGIVVGQAPAGGFAFVWQDGELDQLTELPGPRSSADVITDDGVVYGWTGFARHESDLFRLDLATSELSLLGAIPGGTSANAYDVNEEGFIVGNGWNDVESDWRPFILTEGRMRLLPLPPLYDNGRPLAVDSNGRVIVGSVTADDTSILTRGAVWIDELAFFIDDLLVPPRPPLEIRTIADMNVDHTLIAHSWGYAVFVMSRMPVLPGDVDGNCRINHTDVLGLLDAWGTDDQAMDIDGSGAVDVNDLLEILTRWDG